MPSFLDGELSAEQAGPLRAHLMDCPDCRESAKEARNLARWFEATRELAREDPLAVPDGFAARVARRAFAGDPGWLPVTPPVESTSPAPEDEAPKPRKALLPFILRFTTVAAAVLFFFSVGIHRSSLPEEQVLDALDALPADIDEPLEPLSIDPANPSSPAGGPEEEPEAEDSSASGGPGRRASGEAPGAGEERP